MVLAVGIAQRHCQANLYYIGDDRLWLVDPIGLDLNQWDDPKAWPETLAAITYAGVSDCDAGRVAPFLDDQGQSTSALGAFCNSGRVARLAHREMVPTQQGFGQSLKRKQNII